MTPPARKYVLPALLFCLCLATLADATDIQTLRNLKFTSIQFPGARITDARGINNLGQIVGSWEDPITRVSHGFVLSGGVYTSIDFPGAVYTTALDINDAGDIVGSYEGPAPSGELFGDVHGFLLTADGELTTITVPGQRVTAARGINNRGQVVGSYSEWEGDQVLGVHGFVLENGTFSLIDFPVPTPRVHAIVTFANGINDAGDVVGGYNDDDIFETRRGFVLRDGVYSTLDIPGLTSAELYGINNAGEIVGGAYGAAVLFSPTSGFYRLVSGGNPKQRFTTLLASDINDWGRIVGDGVKADGSLRGFLAEPPSRR